LRFGGAGRAFYGGGRQLSAPLYQAWAQQYKALTGDELNYQAIGSGGGIRQIGAGTVDFGASDSPCSPPIWQRPGWCSFPPWWAGGAHCASAGVAPGQLRLTARCWARSFWPYQALERSAPGAGQSGLRLPPLPITVVHRFRWAGTTFIFTSYLRKCRPAGRMAWPAIWCAGPPASAAGQ
jgi:phosphate transport system substrate-binding protein